MTNRHTTYNSAPRTLYRTATLPASHPKPAPSTTTMGTQSEVSMAEMASHNEQPAAPALQMPPGPGNPGPLGMCPATH